LVRFRRYQTGFAKADAQKARWNATFRLSGPPINGRKRSLNGAKTAPSTTAVGRAKIEDIIEHQ
jgi:hypothetical protein